MKKYDLVAIGDTVIDAFIKLGSADRIDIVGTPSHEDYKICLPFAEKIPYEEVEVVNAVGNAANAAVSSARLGLATALITNLGADQNGKDCLASLDNDKVSTEFIKINDAQKTNYHYVLWYQTERTILIKHEKYSYTLPNFDDPTWVYFSSISKDAYPYHDSVAEYLEKHPSIKFAFQPGKNEINLGMEKLKRLYARADIFFCNVEEARGILNSQSEDIKELIMGLNKLGPKMVVITDGPAGAHGYDGADIWFTKPYPDPQPPYERTGAGDAFSSTIVAALNLGKSLPDAMLWGGVNSMSVVQGVGAQKGLLHKDKLEEWLAKAPADYKATKI
jgi:ribokinase